MYPILFEFGFITVYALWFFVMVGFFAGSMLFTSLTMRSRIKIDLLTNNAYFLFIIGLIGARAVFIATHPEYYVVPFSWSSLPSFFAIWDKGLSFWGALVGWGLGLIYIARKENEPLSRLLDAMAPALTLGMFFGSIGAFLDGINYGTPSELPWALIFKSANVKYIAPIHPTQLYSAFYLLIITGILLKMFWQLRGKLSGFIAESALFLVGVFKFFEEFFRGDEAASIGPIRIQQLFALAAACFGAYLIYIRYQNRRGKDPEEILKSSTKRLLDFFQRIKRNVQESVSSAPTPPIANE